ncbi:hypothetical protein NE237_004171 [Protea cynaroides]|uniref:Uncharacterized protein n=1 Tax=Protea cynaroides TaxID=273540 RepID=A0A9Q0KID2_9MAGN|nr:hypothetical protein NE237_004171 [Protea cynaroides]
MVVNPHKQEEPKESENRGSAPMLQMTPEYVASLDLHWLPFPALTKKTKAPLQGLETEGKTSVIPKGLQRQKGGGLSVMIPMAASVIEWFKGVVCGYRGRRRRV